MQSWAPFNNAYLFISELVWLCCPHRDINTFQLLQNKKCIYTKLKCTHYGITQTHTHTFAFACLFKKAFPPCFKHTTDPGSTREAADTRVFRADKPWGAYGAFLEHFFFSPSVLSLGCHPKATGGYKPQRIYMQEQQTPEYLQRAAHKSRGHKSWRLKGGREDSNHSDKGRKWVREEKGRWWYFTVRTLVEG